MESKFNAMKRGNPLYSQTLINTGKGPTIILLHGLFGNYKMWSRVVEALRNDFHVVVPRLPLFDLPVQNTNIKYLVEVFQEFIEWHEFRNVTLVGHALGGQLALMYTYTHPENVSKLVLTGSTGLLVESPLTNDSLLKKTITKEFVSEIVNKAFHEKTTLLDYFTEEVYLVVQNIPQRLVIGSLLKSLKQNDVTQFLNKIDHPTLLLWGFEDKLSPPETALHFHDYLRNSELNFIKECGHVAMVDCPDAFNQNLVSFLERASDV